MIRYVVTHMGTKGLRTMTLPSQARNTHETQESAETAMADLLNVEENGNDIPGVFGKQAVGTFEVRPVECWKGGDPKSKWFD